MMIKREFQNTPVFTSFVWAGFECTYALAENQKRFDLLAASKHDALYRSDYQLLYAEGIRTAREGLAWHEIDTGDGYDFSRFEPLMRAAAEEGIQLIWDLNHFDYPEDIDPFSEKFTTRFAEYAKRTIDIIRKYQKGILYIVPLNEPSFYAWMCDNALWAPYATGRGTEFKKQLIKTAIRAMDAIWSVDRDVQFIHTDPYMYRTPLHRNNPAETRFCDTFNEKVKFHAWDMLSGKTDPELGGDKKYLSIIGINYYFYNQQFVGISENTSHTFRSVSLSHKKRRFLSHILQEVYDRYQTPLVIAETGSYRKRRPEWWSYMVREVERALSDNIPLYGMCAYPTLDIQRGAGFIVPQSGLWDFDQSDPTCRRIPHQMTLEILSSYTQWTQISAF